MRLLFKPVFIIALIAITGHCNEVSENIDNHSTDENTTMKDDMAIDDVTDQPMITTTAISDINEEVNSTEQPKIVQTDSVANEEISTTVQNEVLDEAENDDSSETTTSQSITNDNVSFCFA